MNILIVDGNEKKASDKYVELGMDTQYEVYSKILNKISKNSLNISIIHPATNETKFQVNMTCIIVPKHVLCRLLVIFIAILCLKYHN